MTTLPKITTAAGLTLLLAASTAMAQTTTDVPGATPAQPSTSHPHGDMMGGGMSGHGGMMSMMEMMGQMQTMMASCQAMMEQPKADDGKSQPNR